MLRVIHLITSLNRGGIEKWLLSLLAQMPRADCAMDVLCKGRHIGPLAGEAETLGARVLHCQLRPDHVRFARALNRVLVEGQYDVVHNHLEVYSALPVWVAHRLNIPVITSFHNTHRPPQESWAHMPALRQLRAGYGALSIGYAVRTSELVTGCSQSVLDSLPGSVSPGSAASRQVLPYGVAVPDPPSSEARASFRASFGWGANTPLILHVGRFIDQKNHLGVLSIMERVVAVEPGVKLLLVGEGPLFPSIERTIAERGLSASVRLLGVRDDVPKLMNMCDVFLFPSFHEGFGLVAIEANASGLPVVGSKIPGLVEAVRDGEGGVLHDPGDEAGMALSILKILGDPSYHTSLASGGKEWVRKHFSVLASTRQLQGTYQEVLEQYHVDRLGDTSLEGGREA